MYELIKNKNKLFLLVVFSLVGASLQVIVAAQKMKIDAMSFDELIETFASDIIKLNETKQPIEKFEKMIAPLQRDLDLKKPEVAIGFFKEIMPYFKQRIIAICSQSLDFMKIIKELQSEMRRHAALIKLLINQGLLIDVRYGESGNTPLIESLQEGYSPLVKVLLETGANVYIRNNWKQLPFGCLEDRIIVPRFKEIKEQVYFMLISRQPDKLLKNIIDVFKQQEKNYKLQEKTYILDMLAKEYYQAEVNAILVRNGINPQLLPFYCLDSHDKGYKLLFSCPKKIKK